MMTLRVELERLRIKVENILFEREEDVAIPEGPDFDLWLEDQLREVDQDLKRIIDFVLPKTLV